MTEESLRNFKQILSKHRDDLLEIIETDCPNKDLNLYGAEIKDVLKVIKDIKKALERIDKEEFGQCKICGGELEIERLHHDFTTHVCLDHYTEDELRNLEKDLELTVKVQKQLLPCCAPCIENLQFAHFIKPAGIVGGDYYDFFSLDRALQGVVIADVMGKGLPASMLLINLQASLKSLGPKYSNLGTLAKKLNELFRYSTQLIRFISLCLISIDMNQGKIQYCNAGHHPPVFWDYDEKKIQWLNPTGPAIGITYDTKYESKSIKISANDILLLYTDGLVEARNNQDIEFGEERLANYIANNHKKSAQDLLTGLRQSAESFAGKFQDDIALLVIKF